MSRSIWPSDTLIGPPVITKRPSRLLTRPPGQTEALILSLEKAKTYRLSGDLEKCEKGMKNCANFDNVSAVTTTRWGAC